MNEEISPYDPVPQDSVFCQKPSDKFLQALEEWGGDPRSAIGDQARKDFNRFRRWMPAWDARDASITAPEE